MKIKKKHLCIVLIFVIIVAIAFFYYRTTQDSQTPVKEKQNTDWTVDKDGYLQYPLDRGGIKFRREDYGQSDNLSIHKIIYQSRNGNIHGLLILPKTAAELLPAVILLPGAGISKESELELAKKISQIDYAVLILDQRGTGETNGMFPNLDEDFASFEAGKEPYQHLMVYDTLRAFDLMKSAPFVDSGRIIIAGESLGGRIAIIAAALDKHIKGVLVISSAGFDFKDGPDESKNTFIKSIDSDHYIGLITPRKLVMMHNLNDKIVPLNSAINSYSKAQSPKRFFLVNDTSCNHGYCDSMYDGFVESLDFLVG